MKITQLYKRAVDWYFGLPWWKKALFFLALIGLLVLAILYVVYRYFSEQQMTPTSPAADVAHKDVVNTVVTQSRAEQKQLEADLIIKKAEAHTLSQQRVKDAQQQRDVRDAISNAKTFEEVDVLLKGLKR